jgi:DNA-binding HxlR family transcriptional regulator
MKTYGDYCPIAMGAEAIGDRWTPLVLRELMVGATRFSDIHRGVPRMSRSLLAHRLRQLERAGLVERRPGPTYHLTEAGQELEPVVFALGDWAKRWLLGDPTRDQLDGAQLMWRVSNALVEEELPEQRTVVQFEFPTALRGRMIWLVLDPSGSTVCERDEGFTPDLRVTADLAELQRVWAGRSTWDEAIRSGQLTIEGPRPLVRAFPRWFALSPFTRRPG